MIFDPKIDPQTAQDGPKTDPRGSRRPSFLMLNFVFDFAPFWAPFWTPLGRHLGLQIGPKSVPKSTKNQLVPTYPEETASRGPKTAPRGPRTPPRGLKIAPRGPQVPPKGPKREPKPAPTPQFGPGMPQDGPKRHHFSPIGSFRSLICVQDLAFVCISEKILHISQEATKKLQGVSKNQHSLRASETPSLRVPAAK